ncbi:MAG: hypothetical protein CL607_24430 [Anaerolineaceae bacterium]|nr:hypothetical protein [Anaerolineaceae bacterium]
MSAHNSVAHLDSETKVDQYVKSRSYWETALLRIRQDRLTMVALTILLCITMMSALAPFITSNILHLDPNQTNPTQNFLPPGTGPYILGTDDIGRDQLARLLHAGGVSMRIGIFGAAFSLSIGVSMGVISGYFGGMVDDVMNWLITTIDSIPSLYLLILFAAIFSPSAETLILVISLISWTSSMRLIRGQTLALREQEYVIAARALGANAWRIMFVHIVPNLISITIISMTLTIAGLILTESALSYLGLGVQPPQATWGNMLSKSQQFFRQGPHLVIFPGLMIFITVLCAYVIGDGLRDAFDPTIRNR